MANQTLNKPDNDIQDHYDSEFNNIKEAETNSAFDDIADNFDKTSETSGSDILNREKAAADSADSSSSGDSNIPFTGTKTKPTGKVTGFLKKRGKKLLLLPIAGGVIGLGAFGSTFFNTSLLETLTKFMDRNPSVSRIGNMISNQTEVIMTAKLMADSSNDEQARRLLQDAENNQPGSSFMGKFIKLFPDKVAENLLLDSEFKYVDRKIGGINVRRVATITINGQTFDFPENQNSLFEKTVHPVAQAKSQWTAYWSTVGSLKDIYKSKGSSKIYNNLIHRIIVAKKIRQARKLIQVSFTKEQVKESKEEETAGKSKSSDETRLDSTEISYNQAAETSTNSDAQDVISQTTECVKDRECLEGMVADNDTIPESTATSLKEKFKPSTVRNVLRSISAVNSLATVLCLIKDFSIQGSQEGIDNQTNGAIANSDRIEAGADQKVFSQQNSDDSRVTASLTGGLNGQINSNGGAIESVPYRRATGEDYTTATTLSPEASTIGTFSTDPAGIVGGGAALETLDDASVTTGSGDNESKFGFCDFMTSIWTQGAIVIGETAANIFFPGTAGLSTAGKSGAALAATRIINGFAQTGKDLFGPIDAGLFLASKTDNNPIADLSSALAIAHVLGLAGSVYNGTAQDQEFINQADAGNTVMAQETARGLGSMPLTNEDYEEVTATTVASMEQDGQDFNSRYFAMDNPKSLAFRSAYHLATTFSLYSISNSFSNFVSSLNPVGFMSKITGLAKINAEPGEDPNLLMIEREYGTVQWGWANDEEASYTGDPNYAPVYNEIVLDESGKRDELMEKYGKCFQPDSVSIGQLLADGDVHRDENAKVDPDKGGCAPKKLGDTKAGDNKLTFQDEEAGLVFRLRVSIRNNATLDDLLGIQDPVVVTGGDDEETEE